MNELAKKKRKEKVILFCVVQVLHSSSTSDCVACIPVFLGFHILLNIKYIFMESLRENSQERN